MKNQLQNKLIKWFLCFQNKEKEIQSILQLIKNKNIINLLPIKNYKNTKSKINSNCNSILIIALRQNGYFIFQN